MRRGEADGRRRAGQRRQVGARGDGAGDPRASTSRDGRRRSDFDVPARKKSAAPDPAAVLKIAQRVVGEGGAREGAIAADIGPDDARALLDAWLRSIGDRAARPRADRPPPVGGLLPRRPLPPRPPHPRPPPARARSRRRGGAVARGDAAGRGRRPLRGAAAGDPLRAADRLPRRREGEAGRALRRAAAGRADRRRDRGDARRHPHDRSRSASAACPASRSRWSAPTPASTGACPPRPRCEVPFYEGMTLGVPGLPDLAETLAEGRYDLVHVTAPGPAGVAAALLSRVSGDAAARPATTPSSPPTPACAAATAASRRSRGRRSAPSTPPPRASSRRARRRTARCSRSAPTGAGSTAGSAASTSPASTPRRPTATPSPASCGSSTPAA